MNKKIHATFLGNNMEREKLQKTMERKKFMEFFLKGIKFRNKILVPKNEKVGEIFLE